MASITSVRRQPTWTQEIPAGETRRRQITCGPAKHRWVEAVSRLVRLGGSGYLEDGGVGQVLHRKVTWTAGILGIR